MQHPPNTVISDMLAGQEAARRNTALVEYERCAERHGVTMYRITGNTRDSVQAAITARMDEVENAPGGGRGTFENPWLGKDGKWRAFGQTVIEPVPA